ncbi:hypothetical protein BACCIP111883_02901 [Sutcliffiella rhizosphaerae]|uniref:Maturase n=1 Tax=Sutcliffiella rhizosphaerae TaxID=2880967 RepID=A0ABN8AA94_9BACI|nr:hypothetical protein BACCIP111883_02901 [Sutcliffiella rhizosphaerae]
MDEWIRRRLRMIVWKEWKHPRTIVRKLKGLGVHPSKAYEWGNSRKKYWRIAPAVQSYTKPLGTPIGVPKGSKVYMQDMKVYVNFN